MKYLLNWKILPFSASWGFKVKEILNQLIGCFLIYILQIADLPFLICLFKSNAFKTLCVVIQVFFLWIWRTLCLITDGLFTSNLLCCCDKVFWKKKGGEVLFRWHLLVITHQWRKVRQTPSVRNHGGMLPFCLLLESFSHSCSARLLIKLLA